MAQPHPDRLRGGEPVSRSSLEGANQDVDVGALAGSGRRPFGPRAYAVQSGSQRSFSFRKLGGRELGLRNFGLRNFGLREFRSPEGRSPLTQTSRSFRVRRPRRHGARPLHRGATCLGATERCRCFRTATPWFRSTSASRCTTAATRSTSRKNVVPSTTLDLANRSAVDSDGGIDGDRLNNSAQLVNSTSSSNWGPPDAVSAGRNMGIVFDYFLQQHGRNSIDDKGVSFFNYVRIGWDGPGGWNNAANIGTTMFFGNGDRWAESLDVVAHEMAHGVTGFTAKLVYQKSVRSAQRVVVRCVRRGGRELCDRVERLARGFGSDFGRSSVDAKPQPVQPAGPPG